MTEHVQIARKWYIFLRLSLLYVSNIFSSLMYFLYKVVNI